MISFENDYSEGAHEEILRRLAEVNKEGITGYGNDSYCESAKEKIRQACKCPEADIYFLVGGTQTNQTVIDSVLQSYEGVIAAETGHVASHEAGAIEASGHKVLTLPQLEGKIQPKDVADYLNQFYSDGNHEHMVFPGMVYISHPTEYGTLYTRGELAELSDICQQYHIPLYLDGARLGYGLAVEDTDVTMEDIAEYCYSASKDEVEKKDYSLVPSKYIEFVNRDENIDFDAKMTTLQSEFVELLKEEEKSKQELLTVFKELGYEIKL